MVGMVTQHNYIDYPIDRVYEPHALIAEYDAADVEINHSTLYGYHHFDAQRGKPTVLVHHGFHTDHFSQTTLEIAQECTDLGVKQVGTTVDLELLSGKSPNSRVFWTPTSYDLEALSTLRASFPSSRLDVTFVHAPTNRAVKSTDAFLDAIETLQIEGLPVKALLIEGRTNEWAIAAKAAFGDVLVDQLGLGYGCNAIEAWALGMPVIAGVNAHPLGKAAVLERMLTRFECSTSPTGLPFYEASEATLLGAMRALATDHELRAQWAAIGLAHVRRHHSHEAHTKAMVPVLEDALAHPPKPSANPRSHVGMSRDARLAYLRELRTRRIAAGQRY